jgi:hypothetical protein
MINKGTATEPTGIQARKFEVGERVEFTDFIIKPVFTRFGESSIVSFADEKGNVIRKSYGNSGLADFLKENKNARSIMLKKKLVDGEYTYNVWSE